MKKKWFNIDTKPLYNLSWWFRSVKFWKFINIVTFGSFPFHGSWILVERVVNQKSYSRRESWITFAKEIRWEILKREESQCKKIKEGLREARASQTTAVAKPRAGAPLPFSTTVSIHMLKFSVSIDLNQFKWKFQPISTQRWKKPFE